MITKITNKILGIFYKNLSKEPIWKDEENLFKKKDKIFI